MRTDLSATCRDKHCHPTRSGARAEANRLRVEEGVRFGVYPCPQVADAYHVGKGKGRPLRAVRRRALEAKYGRQRPRLAPAERFTAADRHRVMAAPEAA